jgi:hypothetical protein
MPPTTAEKESSMAGEIAGMAHWELGFDDRGRPDQGELNALLAEVPARGITDLMLLSHGWNSDRGQARRLYRLWFEQVPGLLGRAGASAATVGSVGVVWPSKRWADEPEPTAPGGGAAGLEAAAPAPAPDDPVLVEDLKDAFPGEQRAEVLDELARLLAERPEDDAALARFQTLMGELAGERDAAIASEDQGELALVEDEPEEVFGRFADAVPDSGEGGPAAGLGDRFGRLWKGAKEALRQLTYFEMKKRAGVVGKDGLGPVLGRLGAAAPDLRIHLLGHSFGARLMSFALAGLPDPGNSPVASLYLLQGAFSHFAFADVLPIDPGRGGALKGMGARVAGPLVASFSVHDLAVGKLYPLASLSSREDAADADDLLFRWGGIGHDGAQAVQATEVDLGPVGATYPFQPGRFVNLNGNAIVNRGGPPAGAHSDIFHPELVWAGLAAAGLVGRDS